LLIGLLSLPLTFIWKTIPDPAWQWEAWESWYPEFMESKMALIFLAYVLITSILINRNWPNSKLKS
ncbi:hypothetical protein, partial [Roseivirga sp.]|uniref:hypothetical protein n=1 Tax=Roseivirga sp. TaxID=1964215 RepID=UPI002356DEB8